MPKYEYIEEQERDPFAPIPDDIKTLLKAERLEGHEACVAAECEVCTFIYRRRNALACALHAHGLYTLTDIGEAAGITRERVRQIESTCWHEGHAAHQKYLDGVTLPTPVTRTVTRKVRVRISPDDLAELKALHKASAIVRGNLRASDPRRLAAEQFMDKIMEVYAKGFSIYEIAKSLGVTNAAINTRLIRYGKKTTAGKSRAMTPIIAANRPLTEVE